MSETVTLYASGTTSQVVSTTNESFLTSPNVNGVFTFHMDMNLMAAGDVVELRIYQMILTGGTQRVAYLARFADAQPTDDQIKISVPIANDLTDTNALRFSILQTDGVARAFPWKVLQY